jgi:hypothetical protein
MEAMSNECGERFNLDISQTEKRYIRKCSPNMLADCCWNLVRETSIGKYKRQKNTK